VRERKDKEWIEEGRVAEGEARGKWGRGGRKKGRKREGEGVSGSAGLLSARCCWRRINNRPRLDFTGMVIAASPVCSSVGHHGRTDHP